MNKTQAVDQCIDTFSDWQRTLCIKLRDLIHAAVPDITEELRYTNRPYFKYKGNVCALMATKDHVNIFLYDPGVADPYGLINQGHDNSTARAIQIYQGDALNEVAFVELITAIAKRNEQGGWRKLVKAQ